MSDNGKCIFWAPEGPMLRVSPGDYKGFVLHIMDLNPDNHIRWALSQDELLTIGRGLIEATGCEETRSWRAVAERLETEMQDLLHACDCEIRDQTNNRQHSDKQSAAYAEGALRVAKGIAHRIREKSAAR